MRHGGAAAIFEICLDDVDQPKIVPIPVHVAGFVMCVFYDHSITTEPSVQRVSCVNLATRRIIAISAAEECFNLLKPTGHVMHQQFNIQQSYALPTLYLRVLCLSQNKQRLVPLTA